MEFVLGIQSDSDLRERACQHAAEEFGTYSRCLQNAVWTLHRYQLFLLLRVLHIRSGIAPSALQTVVVHPPTVSWL